jgi:hypothetical protein
MRTYFKAPDATKNYGIDWFDFIPDDQIMNNTWECDDGLTIESYFTDGFTTVAWISGGTPGQAYYVYSTITTFGGLSETRAFIVTIRPSIGADE